MKKPSRLALLALLPILPNVNGMTTLQENYAVWVFDNADPYYSNPPPYDDTLTIRGAGGGFKGRGVGLNITQGIGGWRTIAPSPDGQYALAVEFGYYPSSGLSRYDISGTRAWFIRTTEYLVAVAPSRSGYAYGLTGGTIFGDELVKIDPKDGAFIDRAFVGGVDLVVDDAHNAIWVVGADIKRASLGLQLDFSIDPIEYSAVSVDVTSDGAAWVAERDSISSNRLLKVGPNGVILNAITLSSIPSCVGVDRSDDSVWVTTFFPVGLLQKFDNRGDRRASIGLSRPWNVRVSQSDHSVWVSEWDGTVRQYSREGQLQLVIPVPPRGPQCPAYTCGPAWLAIGEVASSASAAAATLVANEGIDVPALHDSLP